MAAPESVAEALVDDTGVLVGAGHTHDARWRRGERLQHLFERSDRPAVDTGELVMTYAELDDRATRLARYLLSRGVGSGDRVGLLFDQAWRSYVAMLAVLKVHAAYVPLDPGFPADRVGYIVGDADVALVLTQQHLLPVLGESGTAVLSVDTAADAIDALDPSPLRADELSGPTDDLCYIIYTSGSTGRPKGVAVEHASICNFVRVAGEVYGIRPDDRVYQGMTIAFDFSVEEIWVPWVVGATLVPRPSGAALVGYELAEFLAERRVTALCCVPTLLATLEDDLPDLRFLLVSGEACPRDLIARWHRADRRFLNVYGPTEATVTATWTTVDPDRPVTIGVPLPTYSVVILDPDRTTALPRGSTGEIGIAGIGLARGYLNRDDLTGKAFIDDFLGIENNPSGRIYRTGDLGRVDDGGHIQYLGRIDTQVKVRGYRIELTEVESVLLNAPGVVAAVVDTHRPDPATTELVGYYTARDDLDQDDLRAHLRRHLPGYMVPAYLERLDTIPMTPSNKADRKNLPAPSGSRSSSTVDYRAPETPVESALAEELAAVLGVERVSADGHFFTDLAVDSLLMSRFCARVRQRDDLPTLTMRQVYQHPTVRELAAALPTATAPVRTRVQDSVDPIRGWRYLLCGAAQTLFLLSYVYFAALVLDVGIGWILAGTDPLGMYTRAVVFSAATLVTACTVPVLLKWLLVGRWKPRSFRVWGLTYFRFWVVRSLLRFNPIRLFAGSPLVVLYLRALGAKVGSGAIVLTQNLPVCTDLLTIGDGAVIRKDTWLTGYRAQAGVITTGRVTVGAGAYLGEAAVLDIDTALGDDAQLGHASCLHPGTAVPAGESWHGSPARPAPSSFRADIAAKVTAWRRFGYSSLQLATMVVWSLPVVLLVSDLLSDAFLAVAPVNPGDITFYAVQLAAASALYVGGAMMGLIVVTTIPRLLSLPLKPDVVYPLYGVKYTLQRTTTRLTNSRTYLYLFGDSSYIVGYLRWIGYDLGRVEQTGSNFGVELKQDSPLLSTVGSGTMVSDGLSVVNADYSGSAFRVRRTEIGPRNFLGNNIVYPPGGRTGDNVLLATKVMVPTDGAVRADTGLLGSPAFEIPRTVRRDTSFDHLKTGQTFRERLAAKNRHNLVTIGLFVLVRCVDLWAVVVLNAIAAGLHPRFGTVATALGLLATYLFVVAFGILVERAALGFGRLKPRFCSIYDPAFWRHERFWKLSAGRYLALFNGTPLKVLVWRLLGVRMGPRVFDDGCAVPEKTLVTIGADAVLNPGSVVQGHSLEDATFKSDHIVLGAGTTLGVAAFTHYGTRVAEHTVVDADAFLMKGSETDTASRWRGNPATELTGSDPTTVPNATRHPAELNPGVSR
ncbi:non-ribosomal peptide synthetase-like protein [Actinokineospora baliensis]|uniref:Pls/PosA family non-ribosomal peptide synthetase n=1 Tax=Actinokineospora baliensis TaxID=547056 RepID=UPI00195EA05A|nr:Pls/PosA family non-ribosomal peptide synthetase [Actinokineospora baliensis]MBM7773397.1 non-ribosomal peptide synthetase-like protein [Actinokineospora baliensis]